MIISGIIFALVSLLHLLRVLLNTEVLIGSWETPMFISWGGFLFAALLAIWAFALSGKSKQEVA